MSSVPSTSAVHLREHPPISPYRYGSWRSGHVFRADLEGLRALAVIAVIAEHLTGIPSGGYVGVDIFFVLSGFLITGILLKEFTRSGRISLVEFYRRRMRRILPAATLVLVATVAVSCLVFRPGRAASIFHDALWAALFAGNWEQAIDGNDYMSAGKAQSPIEHYWSLGVEEQFYLLWPLIFIALLWLGRKVSINNPRRFRIVVLGMGLIVLVSFGYSVWETGARPSFAYFDSLGRAWELGAGALLALLAPQFKNLPYFARFILVWSGLAAIGLSLIALGPNSTFPGPWAVLPVLGTAAIIVAGSGANPADYEDGPWLLANPVSRYLGRISFSLYLWHFPVIILLGALMPKKSFTFYLLAILLMLALSVLSFHFVEDPIRRSRWLEPRQWGTGRRFKNSEAPSSSGMIGLGVFGLITVLVTAGLVMYPLTGVTSSPVKVPIASTTTPVLPSQPTVAPVPGQESAPQSIVGNLSQAEAQQSAAIKKALSAKSWPNLTPSLDQFTDDGMSVKAPQWVAEGCLGEQSNSRSSDPKANAGLCTYGDPQGSNTVVLYGDSVAISYLPGLIEALKGQSWKIKVYTVAGCPIAEVAQTAIGGEPFPECNDFRNWALGTIASEKPQLVVASEYRNDLVLVSNNRGAAASAERKVGLQKTLSKLAATGVPTLYLPAPPDGKILASCASNVSSPADCVASPTPLYQQTVKTMREAVASSAGSSASFVDPTQWFCDENNCPAFIGSTPMHADGYHLTAAGSQQIAPLLAGAMKEALTRSR